MIDKNKILVEVSARHIHISQKDLDALFGEGYQLTKYKDLSQPGQFAANEKIALVNGDKIIEHVRILGPTRPESQIELSMTDAHILGIKPPIRMSGDLEGTPGCEIWGLNGRVKLEKGVIISHRHMHASPKEAEELGLKDHQFVDIKVETEREVIFDKVLVRVNPEYALAVHLDTDEGNAAKIESMCFGSIINK